MLVADKTMLIFRGNMKQNHRLSILFIRAGWKVELGLDKKDWLFAMDGRQSL